MSKNFIIQKYKDATPFFVSRVSVVFNNSIAKTGSGMFLNMDVVAAFDLAQKISNFALVPISMMNQAIYPNISRNQSKTFAQKCLYLNIGISVLVALCTFTLSTYAVEFFAKESLPQAVTLTQILCIWIFLGGIVTYLGSPVLVAFGHPKPFNNSILLSTLSLLLFYYIMFITDNLEIKYFAYALCGAELIMLVYRFYYSVHYKILHI